MSVDIVDQIVGVSAVLDRVRNRRPETREQLQASFDALFSPVSDTEVTGAERELVAAFATRLTADDATAAFYAERAVRADERSAHVLAAAEQAAVTGPFGVYIEAGLQGENTEGKRWVADPELTQVLGAKLAAGLNHAHLLVFRPREADADDLARLNAAGWSDEGIVTLSQLVSFLAFQQRVIWGLSELTVSLTRQEVSA